MTIPTGFLNALDSFETLPAAARLRVHSYELLALNKGDRVVDVGCGTGRAAAELAARHAIATGIDHHPAMVEVARGRHPDGDYRVGDAHRLPFADGELHGYRTDKVLHDLTDPHLALHEARRVLSRNGRLVVVDLDWDAISIASDDPERTRAVVHRRTDKLAAGFAARQAPEILRALGFTDVHTTAESEVVTTPELGGLFLSRIAGDADDWLAGQRNRAKRGDLLLVIPILVTAATRA
ncbi:Methyltransferase domain-containing protein [Asanoa ishikariensis]|uniref:Methyltransferase domain-containing protein n=1 Tax=Asanoa ishikariensis TaxID=137265 RepID=A0A1H3T210_9ACTN|nr:methyltransferase domain-containing protein [Asanoa ishikariensis]SDZ44070.1 Methyltransferase domain-containing protein [Asanoa ishikariensis]